MPLCVVSELLSELVHHWDDVISVLLNTVQVDLLSATGDLHLRFAIWSIIMQIGEENIPFIFCVFSFCGVKYKIRLSKYSTTVRILSTE